LTRSFRASIALLVPAQLATIGCSDPLDLCTPQRADLAFFSKGDCLLTRARFFQGHEWLTDFGNRDLPEDSRFSSDEIADIAEGNRRVDWPKELLIHMNAGVLAYTSALTEYTDRPEIQRYHFLLDDKNDSATAAAASRESITRVTADAMDAWPDNRARALALLGHANHTLQDSFSPAHTVRDESRGFCITKVKAFVTRARGYDTPDIEYHGTPSDSIGHTTTQDSIYREGRDCHEPTTAGKVEACLSEPAKRARAATMEYLQIARQLIARVTGGEKLALADVEAALENYHARNLSLCE
jgi:hypothetical protein